MMNSIPDKVTLPRRRLVRPVGISLWRAQSSNTRAKSSRQQNRDVMDGDRRGVLGV